MSPGRSEAAIRPIAQPAPLRELLAGHAGPDSTGDLDPWPLTSEGGWQEWTDPEVASNASPDASISDSARV